MANNSADFGTFGLSSFLVRGSLPGACIAELLGPYSGVQDRKNFENNMSDYPKTLVWKETSIRIMSAFYVEI